MIIKVIYKYVRGFAGIMSEVLYLQINKNVEVSKTDVTIGDIATLYCAKSGIVERVKTIKVINIPDVKAKRVCVSTMFVIKLINEVFPEVEVNNLGESDFIVDYIDEKPKSRVLQGFLIGFVALFTFVGSTYAIMAYNNDVGTVEIFERIYGWFGGGLAEWKVLEISYAVGLAAGIIVFYNHFAGKRFGSDPTPIEVEMDKYEGDIDTALIDRSQAAGKEKGV